MARSRAAFQIDDEVLVDTKDYPYNGIIVDVNDKAKRADVYIPSLEQTYTYRFHELRLMEDPDEKKYDAYGYDQFGYHRDQENEW